MQRLQAFKYELMPDGAQRCAMGRYAGSCRFVYNKALALQQATHQGGGKFISYVDMAKHLTAWRNGADMPWLKDAPVHPLQHALKALERSYKNFFANVKAGRQPGFPRFKRKGSSESFRYPDAKQIKFDAANARIFLPKLGWMRLRLSRPVLGELRNVTVSCSAGRWYASIQTQRDVADPVPAATSAIGIDMGISRFATFSNGSFIEPLASFKRHEQRLARYQRRMSRKVKGSCNHKKAKARVQRIHADIANARRDFLHKATSAIARAHALVAIEDLQVRSMSGSARGSAEQPGQLVRQKAGLNRAILDQGWFEFRRQLQYKLDWAGGQLIAVGAQHTSQTCPVCTHVDSANRTSQAHFACVRCGYENNADVVGAMNVLARGHRVAVCGEDVRPGPCASMSLAASVKQEPTEVTGCEVTHA